MNQLQDYRQHREGVGSGQQGGNDVITGKERGLPCTHASPSVHKMKNFNNINSQVQQISE